MINWMQKHRKYLVVTIWISTIAFVGAGFVGWGAYSFGKNSGSVAKVGEIDITYTQMQQEYSRLFSAYNQMFGGKLDKEQAQNLGIEEQAMNNLITQTLLLNFAKDIGIRVIDEEVAKEIASIEAFRVDGKFSNDRYKQILSQNGYKTTDFEESIRRSIAIDKMKNILKPSLTDLEKETIAASFYIKDKIEIEILDANDFSPSIGEDELRAFWEQNKQNYLTSKVYTLESIISSLKDISLAEKDIEEFYEENRHVYRDKDERILPFEEAKIRVETDAKLKDAQKDALQKYISLKKGTIIGEELVLSEENGSLGNEVITKLNASNIGDTLKPIEVPSGYITLKVKNIKNREPKSFEDAKLAAREDLLKRKRLEMLQERAASEYKNFSAGNIGFVSRDDIKKIPNLNQEESAEFLKNLFASTEDRGYVLLENKAVLYRILEQKLLDSQRVDENVEFVEQNALQLKQSVIEQAFIESLQNNYKIIR